MNHLVPQRAGKILAYIRRPTKEPSTSRAYLAMYGHMNTKIPTLPSKSDKILVTQLEVVRIDRLGHL